MLPRCPPVLWRPRHVREYWMGSPLRMRLLKGLGLSVNCCDSMYRAGRPEGQYSGLCNCPFWKVYRISRTQLPVVLPVRYHSEQSIKNVGRPLVRLMRDRQCRGKVRSTNALPGVREGITVSLEDLFQTEPVWTHSFVLGNVLLTTPY